MSAVDPTADYPSRSGSAVWREIISVEARPQLWKRFTMRLPRGCAVCDGKYD
jgi:hypothetical protein